MSRRRGSLYPLLAVAACAAVAGCGSAGSPGATAGRASITVLAPTSGATVAVRTLTVTGTVSPAGAPVLVDGGRATVRGATFERRVTVGPGTTEIPVSVVGASGPGAAATVAVRFSPALARALRAARAAALAVGHPSAVAPPDSAGAQSLGQSAPSPPQTVPTIDISSPAQAGAIAGAANGNPGAGLGRSARAGSGPSAGLRSNPSAGAGSNQPAGAGSPPSNGGGSQPSKGGGSPAAAASPPASHSGGSLGVAGARAAYVAGCVRATGTHRARAFCACTYRRIQHAGALRTGRHIRALIVRIAGFAQTGNADSLPTWLRTAIAVCAARLQAAPPAVRPIASLHHASAGP
ncbi:MAG TPA: hypothetical protein VKV27_05520 [Solirubrobacteraceae bacterium]|nr:hypothetical protein [Solirubrobacteraceae bacterium]